MSDSKVEKAIQELTSKALTNAKPKFITGVTPTAVNAMAIQFVTAGTFTALAGNYEGTATGITYPAGFIIYGRFSSITLGDAAYTVVVYQF